MIRFLRILEYTYDDAEQAQRDMDNWSVPQNGAYRVGNSARVIRSTVITNFISEADVNAIEAGRFREIQEVIRADSLASDGWEMIEAGERRLAESNG